jgi:hypothetical protein
LNERDASTSLNLSKAFCCTVSSGDTSTKAATTKKYASGFF